MLIGFGKFFFFFFQAGDGIRDGHVTGVQTCALPIYHAIGRGHNRPRPFLRSGKCADGSRKTSPRAQCHLARAVSLAASMGCDKHYDLSHCELNLSFPPADTGHCAAARQAPWILGGGPAFSSLAAQAVYISGGWLDWQ